MEDMVERHQNAAGDFALISNDNHIEIYRLRGPGWYELVTSMATTPEEIPDNLAEFGF